MREEAIADSVMQGMEPSDGCLLQQSVLSYHEQLLGAEFTQDDKTISILGALLLR